MRLAGNGCCGHEPVRRHTAARAGSGAGQQEAARGAYASGDARRLHRPGAHSGRGQAAAPADRTGRADVHHPVGAAGCWQNDAGEADRARDALRVHPVQRRVERHQRDQSGDGGCGAAAPAGAPYDPVHRRDSPFQQSPAGRLSALCGARRHHPDRSDHGESVV